MTNVSTRFLTAVIGLRSMRILLAQDDPHFRLAFALRREAHVVDSVETQRAALAALATTCYDVIVLDIDLPDGSALGVLSYLNKRGSTVPVMILSTSDSVEKKVIAFDLGADHYVTKPVALAELMARIRALIRRGRARRDPIVRIGILCLDTGSRQAFLQEEPLPLTAREWSVLEHLATRRRRVVTKDQLLRVAFSGDKQVTLNAVERVIYRLRTKVRPHGVHIETVHGVGYLVA